MLPFQSVHGVSILAVAGAIVQCLEPIGKFYFSGIFKAFDKAMVLKNDTIGVDADLGFSVGTIALLSGSTTVHHENNGTTEDDRSRASLVDR